jgi:hypothetical protein
LRVDAQSGLQGITERGEFPHGIPAYDEVCWRVNVDGLMTHSPRRFTGLAEDNASWHPSSFFSPSR